MNSFSVFILLCLLGCTAAAVNLGDYVTPCKSKDPGLNECLRRAAQDLFTKGANGIPELGVPALDPAKVDKLSLDPNGALTLSFVFNNSTHVGLSKIKILSASADTKNHAYTFSVCIPQWVVSTEYVVNGRILLLPITGNGHASLNMTDTCGTWSFSGAEEQRDGDTFLRLDKLVAKTMDGKPTKVKMYFDGLFGGNKVIGETLNNFLNTNWKEITRLIIPNLDASFARRILPIAQSVVSKFPLNQLFSDL